MDSFYLNNEDVKNYIKNRALEDVSQVISDAINKIIDELNEDKRLIDPVGFLFENGLTEWFKKQSRDVQDEFLGIRC